MTKRVLFLVGALLLIATLPAGAQGTGWRVWVYEQVGGKITVVDQAGMVTDEFTLPMLQGFDAYPYNVAVSPDGSAVAYVVANTLSDPVTYQLVVYDRLSQFIAAVYSFPADLMAQSLELVIRPALFNEAEKKFAFGYLRGGAGTWSWEIVLVSYGVAADPVVLNSANQTAIPASGLPLLPVVQSYTGGQVGFTLVLYAAGGAPEYQGYRWDAAAGTVTPSAAYVTPISDLLPTGEVIMPLYDSRLPNINDQFAARGPVTQLNSLHVYDPARAARFPFYNEAGLTIVQVYFIQNGERILFNAYNLDGSQVVWRVIGRDGAVVGDVEVLPEVTSVMGTPDGYVYTLDSTRDPTVLVAVNTASGVPDAGKALWYGEPARAPRIVRVEGDTPAPASAAPWAQLAAPVS